MKSGTESKLKFRTLQKALNNLSLNRVRGILDTMWWFAGNNCPAGDIGRFTNEEIGVGIDWRDDEPFTIDELISALVKHRWLDESKEHRLIVHDWPEHCEDSIHMSLARRREFFADGTKPKTSRLSGKEREEIESFFEQHDAPSVHTTCTRRAHKSSLPVPIPDPASAIPSPATPCTQRTGVFSKLSEADLQNTETMLAWQQAAAKQKRPVISSSQEDSLNVLGAAELAIERGNEPVGLFVRTIKEKRWDWITNAQADRASDRYKSVHKPRDDIGDNHLRRSALALAQKKLDSEGEA